MTEIEIAFSEPARPPSRRVLKVLSNYLRLLSVLVVSIGFVSPAMAGENPDLAWVTYTRILKGSSPEYLSITTATDGTGTYDGRSLSDPSSPRPLKLSPKTTRRIFDLARAMNNFQSIQLESHKRVANLGLKTFTFEREGEKHSVEFNFTLHREGSDLQELFEKLASVEQHVEALEYAIKYDHLSLPRELQRIQTDLNNQALADPELLVPSLERIAQNSRFLHLARSRAQEILHRVRQAN